MCVFFSEKLFLKKKLNTLEIPNSQCLVVYVYLTQMTNGLSLVFQIPPEMNRVLGMFLVSSHTSQGVWKPRK